MTRPTYITAVKPSGLRIIPRYIFRYQIAMMQWDESANAYRTMPLRDNSKFRGIYVTRKGAEKMAAVLALIGEMEYRPYE